ncbi:MAG: hypothetical protein PWP65_104 [Clostridia bacterium]|nr:hypothetical protein [Clostridia bacterium]
MPGQGYFRGLPPLLGALENYRRLQRDSWHTPGHKDGAGAWPAWRDFIGPHVFACDLTELPDLDNLQQPAGAIRAAQEQAAAFFGAGHTFFLVNGATAGILSVFLATCSPGDVVLLPRYAHRSAFAGLILTGARPVYLEADWLKEPLLPLGIRPEVLAAALEKHPRARLLFLVYPTYEGIVPRAEGLIALAHAHHVEVLADEAHGSHYGLEPRLPSPALKLGADYVVQGAHKTLSAFTQAAMLHIRQGLDWEKVAAALNLVQTTSPSYLLLASLDAARYQAQLKGRELWTFVLDLALELRDKLSKLGLPCLGPEEVCSPAALTLDLTRLVIPTAPLGCRGEEAAETLRRSYRQEVEMAGKDYLLILLTPGDREEKVERLVAGLQGLARRSGRQLLDWRLPALPVHIPPFVLTPREAFLARRHRVPLKEAAGKVAAEIIAPCPPGCCLTAPGELLTEEMVDYLRQVLGPEAGIMVVEE